MPRQIILSNGTVAVALDSKAQIRDFYFPHVGLENHVVSHQFKIGFWMDDKFSWLHDDWQILMKYLPETLVSRYLLKNEALGINMEINDAVHPFNDVLLRKVTINNNNSSEKEIRLFFTQDFHIYGYDAGDTAFFEPKQDAMVHYKRKRYFLISGNTDFGEDLYQYAAGLKENVGVEGTWRDAEDGELSGSPVAQGSVDSAVSLRLLVGPDSIRSLYYWIACGKNLKSVYALNSIVRKAGVEQMLLETENYWSAWLNKHEVDLTPLPRDIARLFKESLLIMRAHVDNQGGILASIDSDALQLYRDTYSYVWPRDGAMVTMAFDDVGFTDISQSFFWFCNSIITDDGFFEQKYLSDGSVGSTWHPVVGAEGRSQLPIQEDETAIILYALWKHYEKHRSIDFISHVYDKLVVKASDFMVNFIDPSTNLPKPTFDQWEEKVGVHTSTVATVYGALKSAAKFARVFYDRSRQEELDEAAEKIKAAMVKRLYDQKLNRFIKAIYSDGTRDLAVDSGISTIFTCQVFDPNNELVKHTMDAIAKSLWVNTEVGGIARYANDRYQQVSPLVPGNPWFISTLRLARWYAQVAATFEDLNKCLVLLQWCAKNALASGALAEQLNPYTHEPLSSAPLAWSHAEFILAVNEYLRKYAELNSAPIPNV